jgi:hypothetical protein
MDGELEDPAQGSASFLETRRDIMSGSNPNTDQDILNDRVPGTNPDLDIDERTQAAARTPNNPLAGVEDDEAGARMDTAATAGPAGTANQTDTTIGQHYTGGPIDTDPEEQLLDPGYSPELSGGSGRQADTPGRPSFADNPTRGGMPNQQGQHDQTVSDDRGWRR